MRTVFSVGLRSVLVVAVVTAVVSGDAPNAQARDFFVSLFGALSGRPPPPPRPAMGYGAPPDSQFPPQAAPPATRSDGGRSTAYCVRTCDGRYFPIWVSNEQSRAATCSSLCPASDTRIFYGASIDRASTESGKTYSSLPNAFRYREELVSGCTCNGKDPVGLASVSIEDDKTIRKGDLVAGENGLTVATRGADRKRGRVANFSPAPQHIRQKFERAQALAVQ